MKWEINRDGKLSRDEERDRKNIGFAPPMRLHADACITREIPKKATDIDDPAVPWELSPSHLLRVQCHG